MKNKEQAVSQEDQEAEKYLEMSEEELVTRANQEDGYALAMLGVKCMTEGAFDRAVEYYARLAELEDDVDAAETCAVLYGTERFGVYDEEKCMYFCVLSETLGSRKKSKQLMKIYARPQNQPLVQQGEREVFNRRLTAAIAAALLDRKRSCLLFTLEKEGKSYALSLTCGDSYETVGGACRLIGAGSAQREIFLFVNREKKRKDAAFLQDVRERLTETAKGLELGFRFVGLQAPDGFHTLLLRDAGAQTQPAPAAEFKAPEKLGKEFKVEVETAAQSLISETRCPACGGAAERGKDGRLVCSQCGRLIDAKEAEQAARLTDLGGGKFRLEVAEESVSGVLAHVNCPQCGGPVALPEKGERFVLCGNCGSTYALNSNVLEQMTSGLDRQAMQTAKPEDAVVPDVSFAPHSVLDGGLALVLPAGFTVMDPEIKALKYNRGNPPDVVYTNPEGTVNLCLTLERKSRVTNETLPQAAEAIRQSFLKLMPNAAFEDRGCLSVNGKNVCYFNCLTDAADQSVYNLLFQTEYQGLLLMGSWNCLGKDRWFWYQIFMVMLRSLRTV